MWKKMNLNIQTPEGLKKVVADMGAEVQARIAELEDMQRRILEMEATFENPGLVTLCDLPGVSDSTGKALPSSEKDATRKGTMAHDIDSLNSNFANISRSLFAPYVPEGNDADNAASCGVVHCVGQIKNVPAGIGLGLLVVFTTGSYVMQIYGSISVSGGFAARTRTENHSAWTEWTRL